MVNLEEKKTVWFKYNKKTYNLIELNNAKDSSRGGALKYAGHTVLFIPGGLSQSEKQKALHYLLKERNWISLKDCNRMNTGGRNKISLKKGEMANEKRN